MAINNLYYTTKGAAMTPEQELILREFAEGIQRAVTEGLEQALCPPRPHGKLPEFSSTSRWKDKPCA